MLDSAGPATEASRASSMPKIFGRLYGSSTKRFESRIIAEAGFETTGAAGAVGCAAGVVTGVAGCVVTADGAGILGAGTVGGFASASSTIRRTSERSAG